MTAQIINDYLSGKGGRPLSKEEKLLAEKILEDFMIYRDICYNMHVKNSSVSIEQVEKFQQYKERLFVAMTGIYPFLKQGTIEHLFAQYAYR